MPYELVPLMPKDVLSLLPPFPIVLVTVGDNIITINQVQYFTFAPLRLGIAVAHTRHTYELLTASGAFVINVPDAGLLEAVRLCGAVSGRDVDKFEATGLTSLPAQQVAACTIAECGAQIECQVDREIAFEHRTWFVGPVVAARQWAGFEAAQALLCGREAYSLPGATVAAR